MQEAISLWPLIGIAVIVVGFVLRFNPVPVMSAAFVIAVPAVSVYSAVSAYSVVSVYSVASAMVRHLPVQRLLSRS